MGSLCYRSKCKSCNTDGSGFPPKKYYSKCYSKGESEESLEVSVNLEIAGFPCVVRSDAENLEIK